MMLSFSINAQKHTDSKSFDFDMNRYDKIHIYNTGGAITVQGNRTGDARIEVDRVLKATTQKKLKRAITEIFVDTMIVDDELFVFISSPYRKLKSNNNDEFLHYQSPHNNSQSKNGIYEVGVTTVFNLNINIPTETEMIVSTHKGLLKVNGVQGSLAAINHHDDVILTNVRDVTYAHSHHGDVQVDFVQQPSNDISFDTHHGDIKVSFPGTPSAQVEFESYHGSFFTDFDWEKEQPKFEKVKSKSKRKATYKLGDKTIVSIGNGGQKMTFDSHHGDFYILKK